MNIYAELLTALVRAGVQVVVGIALARGIISAQQAGHFTAELTVSIASAVTAFVVTYGFSAWNKIKARFRFLTALEASPSTPAEAVIKLADSSSVAVQIRTATSPGNVEVPKD